ncbi:AAA family ATPase [Candidatus Babeliales bacterium]|nr:AAA family ATPase [Candidatus Babeliales bacterium]
MSDLMKGVQQEPNVIIGYGVPGVGKSTFAAGSKNPLFIGPERNGSLNVSKLKRSMSHDQLCQQMRDIEKGKYDKENFRTIVLDSIDMHEKVIHKDITNREPGTTMATAMKGYGKAYTFAGSKLYEIKQLLDNIRSKKEMDLIVLGHSIVTPFTDPMLATSYEIYEMCLHKSKRVDYNSIFTDWADMVLFFNWKAFKTEDGNHAVSIGKREILTEFRPSHLAKNRFNLPYSIEMDQNPLNTFNILQGHIDAFYSSGAQANTILNDFNILVHECKSLMSELNDESIKPQIEQAVNSECTNATTNPQQTLSNLLTIRDRIKEIVSNQ